MATKLENLEVSMISLVKSGANKKSIIYKSAKEPNLSKDIKIIKSDEEGVVYGIVYSPNEIDSQGDFADANTIKTAAYSFMKSGFAKNVDREHSFNNVDAYVCQSWLIKSGDPVFPDEKEGSWAVAIKLESDELKDAVKKGEISGISMAGVANKIPAQETSKSENSLTNLIKSIENIFKQIMSMTHTVVRDRWFDNDEAALKYRFEVFNDYEIVLKNQVSLAIKTQTP